MKVSTKEKIISAAVDILEEFGIQALTQLSVAKKIKISQGQLTYHFPKRNDLILAATEVAINRLAESVFNNKNISTNSKIEDLIWSLVQNHLRIRAQLGLVIEADQSEELRKKLIEQEERVRSLIAFGLGVNINDPLVTSTHATLLGFGVISFVRGQNLDHLKKDYLHFVNQFRQTLKNNKKAKTK